jgi:hypothetical protein
MLIFRHPYFNLCDFAVHVLVNLSVTVGAYCYFVEILRLLKLESPFELRVCCMGFSAFSSGQCSRFTPVLCLVNTKNAKCFSSLSCLR